MEVEGGEGEEKRGGGSKRNRGEGTKEPATDVSEVQTDQPSDEDM